MTKSRVIFILRLTDIENYYVLDPVTAKEYISYTDNYIHPLWGFSSDFLHNVDGFGYFHRTNQLVNRNLSTNIYEAVVDGRNVYVIDKNITFIKENYLNQYYGKKIPSLFTRMKRNSTDLQFTA